MNENIQDLANEKMVPLFLKMSIPIAISLVVAGLYNVVDAIFIARGIGTLAMGGVSMVFPIQMAIAALAALVSTGMASLMARHNGAGEYKLSADVARLSLLLGLLISIGLFSISWQYVEELLNWLAVSDGLRPYSKEYIQPILLVGVTSVMMPIVADIFRSEGRMQTMMLMILASSFLNILLDALFIFVFNWGVAGAAWATVIAQSVAILIGVVVYIRKPPVSDIRQGKTLNWKLLPLLLGLGLPIFVAQLSTGVQSGAVNFYLQLHGAETADIWVSAFGILGRLFTFIFLPLIAMLIAFQTICGYNIGANKTKRVAGSIRVSFASMFIYSVVQVVLVVSVPEFWVGLFSADAEILATSKTIIYTTLWTLPTAAVFMVATGFYQARGNAIPAIFFSGARVFLILLPLLIILPNLFGFMGIIWALPLADVFAAGVTLIVCSLHLLKHRQSRPEPA